MLVGLTSSLPFKYIYLFFHSIDKKQNLISLTAKKMKMLTLMSIWKASSMRVLCGEIWRLLHLLVKPASETVNIKKTDRIVYCPTIQSHN